MKPIFFKTPSELRQWFEKHHDKEQELLVGFYKKDSGKASITWPESVDQALCFGWIDGIRRGVDEFSYTIRFTPRRPRSVWSAVNMKRVGELEKLGLMQPSGFNAFAARKENRSGIYSYEQRSADLPEEYRRPLKKNKTAWNFFEAQSPSYRKAANWWVLSAKKEETRLKRLDKLINYSAKCQTILNSLSSENNWAQNPSHEIINQTQDRSGLDRVDSDYNFPACGNRKPGFVFQRRVGPTQPN